MRYEAIRLMQFVFSMCLIGGAFLAGLYAGWRRWGSLRPVDRERPGPRLGSTAHDDAMAPVGDAGRRDLFAPDIADAAVDLRSTAVPVRVHSTEVRAIPNRRAITASIDSHHDQE